MPELGFYLSEEEEDRIAAFILRSGASMVPEKHYPTRFFTTVTTIDEFKKERASTRFFLCLRSDFSKSPLTLERAVGAQGPFFFVKQRDGGPTLDFLVGVKNTVGTQMQYGQGFIAYHHTYWDPSLARMSVPDKALVTFYKEVAKFIRSFASRMQLGMRQFWIGDDLRSRLTSDVSLVGFEHIRSSLFRDKSPERSREAGGPHKTR